MVESLISFAVATLLLALSPGPDNIYVLSQSLAKGSRVGIATTAGLISGCIVHTALLAFGVSAILTASQTIFYLIKIAGAGYLLYLAYRVYISDATIAIENDKKSVRLRKSYWDYFKIGVVMNLINPKVMIFFLAFFPAFLWNKDENTIRQLFVLGGVFMLVSFIVFSGIALMAGYISNYIRENKNVPIILKWMQILVFVGIAIFILIP